MIDVRAARLRALLTIATQSKKAGLSELKTREVLNKHCIKAWQLSYNARHDYIETVMSGLEDE